MGGRGEEGAGSGGGNDPTREKVVRLELVQQGVLLTGAGQERQLTVRALNGSGAQIDANVVWTSSAPERISVDATGKVRAVTPLGSAQITAESGGVRSRPLLVMTAELHPGTLQVTDANVVRIGEPLTSGPPLPRAGIEYDVWLSGVAPPQPGTVVLAVEDSPVAGRVVEAAIDGNLVRVRLRLLDMPDVLARYDIDWVIDVTAFDMVYDPAAAGFSTRRDEKPLSHERRLDSTEVRVPDWSFPPGSPSPLCRASAAAKLTTQPTKVKVGGSPKIVYRDSHLHVGLPSGTFRLALVGDFKIETQVGLVADAGLSGTVECELPPKALGIPIPIAGPFGLSIPVSVGLKVKGEVELAKLDISLSGENGASFELGVDCKPAQPCTLLDTATPINKFEPHLEVHGANIDGMRIKLGAHLYFHTGLNVVLLGRLVTFEAVDVKVGPKQTADFGTLKRQADDRPYASNYKLFFLTEIAPGKSAKKAIEFFTGVERDEFSMTLPIEADISESPNGTWSVDKTNPVPNRDTVLFDIRVKPQSKDYFLLGYNIKRIEIYRKHESAPEYELVQALPATQPQVDFQWRWEPTTADAGRNDFAVFAVSNFEVVPLEIGTVASVQVGCIGGIGTEQMRALAAGGVCKEEWVGSASGEIFGAVKFNMPAPFLWEQDLTTVLAPGISALRPAKTGNLVTVEFTLWKDLGCTVTPERFDGSSFSAASLMTVDRNFDPPKYAWGLQIDAELTISCPDGGPGTLPGRVIAIDGLGELTERGTRMQGITSNQFGRSSYDFRLKEPDPPSPQAR
ncbi:MAG: hypothetical protein KIT17_03575 [Rubrivivax sp.]|nr:hypothetical protein [Rubrivivax sp.]